MGVNSTLTITTICQLARKQCIEKSTSVIWEMRGILKNTQLQKLIEGLKVDLKYKL